jgi:LPXTG-motif cell wall-anchored protein
VASAPAAGTAAITDTATLTGRVSPITGSTVTFNLYGTTDTTCSSLPVFVSSVVIAANGTATSAAFTPVLPGVYRWVATFGGDANNNGVSGTCGDPAETITVEAAALPVPTPELPATGATETGTAGIGGLLIAAGWSLRRFARRRPAI